MRTFFSADPQNRILLSRPPEGYQREAIKNMDYDWTTVNNIHPMPNQKFMFNRPQLIGLHQKYVEGNWQTRKEVIEQHKQATLHLLWFMQNDPEVPEDVQKHWESHGLAQR